MGNAKDTVNNLTEKQLNIVFQGIENTYPDGLGWIQLNNIFSFNRTWIANLLGFDDWENLIAVKTAFDDLI